MPLYLNIDRLSHTVTVVAHGTITDDEIRDTARDVLAADVASYAKILDTTAATTQVTPEQIAEIVRLLREGWGDVARGPIACVVDPRRPGFPRSFAEQSHGDWPISLFNSLREARAWIERTRAER